MTVVLGAGASRDVSYAYQLDNYTPSPLDTDFFNILQRIDAKDKDRDAVNKVLKAVRALPYDCWRSLERAFYTLHLRAVMEEELSDALPTGKDRRVVEQFTRCLQAVLREAHGSKFCQHHQELFTKLGNRDAIISFNYDLVAERALCNRAHNLKQPDSFGRWVYGLGPDAKPTGLDMPVLLKLHGSSNWQIDSGEIQIKTASWEAMFAHPGYGASSANYSDPSSYPIILPYWEKPIEQRPWVDLWRLARKQLQETDYLLVWGYSLPDTDVKTRHLFSIALAERKKPLHLCVIDPSAETQRRWRELFREAKYWEFDSFVGFDNRPPEWWVNRAEITHTMQAS